MSDYKVNFKQMKSRVGIDDVAYALGYRLDRKAGVGRFIELVLTDGSTKRDTIIVSNPHDKARQLFFRRDGSKGDVVTLIRENLSAFFTTATDDWQRIAQVLARFANMPEPEYKDSRDADRQFVAAVKQTSQAFNKDRYEVKAIDTEHIPALFSQRRISAETVKAFAPFLSLIRDKQNGTFDGFNVGFPYINGASDEPQGYEIRGYGGYKSKAAGTNSSTAAWVADFSQTKSGPTLPQSGTLVKSVFFFESALDAMSFWQINRARLNQDIALVSLGGTFSDGQIRSMTERFPNARGFDCFDNDKAGRVYGERLKSLVSDFAQWLPPKNFKDWNDCLMNKPLKIELSPSKEQRNVNLAERRSAGMKF